MVKSRPSLPPSVKSRRKLVPLAHGSDPRGQWMQAPIMTVSETNMREHHMARHSRRANQRKGIALMAWSCLERPKRYPCTITLTRIAPRLLDHHDNLRSSLKGCVDGIADWLGVRDDDPCVVWEYDQRRDDPRTYGVRVHVVDTTFEWVVP